MKAGLICLASLLLAACGPEPAGGQRAGSKLLVSAAASLSDAFSEVAIAFEKTTPEVDVILNLAGSSALGRQILEGAPADVYASADGAQMDRMVAAGEVSGDPRVFVLNRLQIAVPAGNPAQVAGLADFARDELLIGLCAPAVPCGDLARRALARAGVAAKPDTHEPNVRALLSKLEAGELDAGLVYATDVDSSARVEGIDIPTQQSPVAAYPIALLAGAPNPPAGAAFIEFVLSDAGRVILSRHGFDSP